MKATIQFSEVAAFSGTYTAPEFGSASFWILLVVSIVFLVLGGLLIWLYYAQKKSAEALRKQHEHRSAGSFVGYWARYRGAIYAFLAALFIIIGATFFLFAFNIVGISSTDLA